MIWQSPWAWLGLGTIALPILIHLFGRGHARVRRFPSLRFIDPSRLLPTRRSRLNDLLLLAIRVAILALAAAALAQPLFVTRARADAANAPIARAVILDTSASMARAADSARALATAVVRDASASLIAPTADPRHAIAGAAAWLAEQSARGEIVIVSDFQAGTIDSAALAAIPRDIGVRLERVRVGAPSASVELLSVAGGQSSRASATVAGERTDIEWSAAGPPASPDSNSILVLASGEENARVAAARQAGESVPARASAATIDVAIVTPGYADRAKLIEAATKPRRAPMIDVALRIAGDEMLSAASQKATIAAARDSAGTLVLARTASGQPVLLAAEGTVDGRDRLLLFPLSDAGSLMTAAVFAATRRALSPESSIAELDPASIDDAQLARWGRPPSARAPSARSSRTDPAEGDSDARWLWLAALLLLAVETWVRRGVATQHTAERAIARDRAA